MSKIPRYKKRFQNYVMDMDRKPKGKDRRFIEKQNRQESKRELLEELKNLETDSEPLP